MADHFKHAVQKYRIHKRTDGYCEEGGCWKRAASGKRRCAGHLAQMRIRVSQHREKIANG